jgi:NADH dehydrogenase
MVSEKQKVLILGGGFGGIKTALNLADNPHYDVTLVSDQSNFRYYPALYHSATGGNPAAASLPLSEIFKGRSIRIIQDAAKKLNRGKQSIECASGKTYSYDILVIALGVVTNYFGIKGLKKYSYSIKTLEDASKLHDHLHQTIADKFKPDLHYVVIGGGATGVELAGALPAYLRFVMDKHYVPQKNIRIELVEAAPYLLPRMSKSYSRAVQKRLRRLGVQLYLNQKVEAETADALMVGGQPIKSKTVIWTAGVTNHPFLAANKFTLTDRGRVQVNELMQAEPDIYVIGDNADTPYCGMAQTALHDAIFISKNLHRLSKGERPLPYKPKRPIYVTPVGPQWAAVQWGKFGLYGRLGWLLREAADLVAYHDIEPWWPAYKHWMASNSSPETCPICMHP